MNRLIQAFAFATILLGLMGTRVRAGLVITLSDVTLAPNGTGAIDVTVASDHGYTLSSFNP